MKNSDNQIKKQIPDKQEDLTASLERFDHLLERGLDRVSDIENEEFYRGLSPEEISSRLQENEFHALGRSEFSTVRKIGYLQFEDDVTDYLSTPLKDISLVPMEDIEKLSSVHFGQKIAHVVKSSESESFCGKLLQTYTDAVQRQAGVLLQVTDGEIAFVAALAGKVVYLDKRIHVVSTDRDAVCTVSVTEDGLLATIDIIGRKGNGHKLTLELVLDKLEASGVVRGLRRGELNELIRKVSDTDADCSGFVVASGKAPVNGTDGRINVHDAPKSEHALFKILPDGRVDYHKQAHINMVTTGDLIATLTEPEAGVDGYTVTGRILQANNGEPVVVFEGENVRKSSDGLKYFATASGMLSHYDNTLSVFPIYQIDGDVDLKSGNILFNGSVLIKGTVRTGFEIKASGDIIILGSAESAHIEAGRDIRINGAVIGGPNSLIKAGRDIYAGHTQNAHFEAQGDVTVVRSIMHSTIHTTGKLITLDHDSSIVGGTINAMRGLEVLSVGSSMGTPTEIIAGSDYLIQKKIMEYQNIKIFFEDNILKIDTILRPLMEFVKKGIPLGGEKKRRLSSIVEKRAATAKQLQHIKFKINKISSIDPEIDKCSISIRKTLFSDVTIRIGQATLYSRESLKEIQCTISHDRKTVEMHPLRKSGQE